MQFGGESQGRKLHHEGRQGEPGWESGGSFGVAQAVQKSQTTPVKAL
jgi:hypothetical protein